MSYNSFGTVQQLFTVDLSCHRSN